MSRPRLIALLLALGTLLVYLPVTRHQFVNYDDGGYVTENPTVKAGLTWHGVKWAFTTWVVGNWHPVTMLSHMLDCQLFGLNSGLQHYENALFHAANTVLLFWLLLRLTQRHPENNLAPPSNTLWPSAFVAALFAWHPLHVESVAWIAERKDVLSTFFELLALMCYARCVTSDRQSSILHSSSYWLALFFFVLGLMSKPMLVTMPFVMLLLDFWPLGRFKASRACPSTGNSSTESMGENSPVQTLLRLTLEKWPFFLLTIIFCVITFWSQHGTGAVNSATDFPLGSRIENSLISYGRYLLKTIWPVNLAVIYPLFKLHGVMTLLAVAMAIALLAVSWLAWKARTRFPWLLTGWFWYLGTLVPVIGLVHVGGASMADRYSYFPLVGIFIIIAFGARNLMTRWQIGAAVPATVATLVLVACITLTERQLTYWQNSVTLFEHAIAVTQDNDIAHSNLGLALEKEGDQRDALAQFKEALRISPNSDAMHNNIADLYYDMGRTNEALEEYNKALQLDPRAAFAWINIGNVDAALGHLPDAMTNYNQAARFDSSDAEIPFLIGKTLLAEGRDGDVIPYFQKVWRLDPDNFQTLTYMARVLASDENPKARNGLVALAMAAKANDLTGGIQPAILDTLAMAYAQIGQFDEAQIAEKDAIKLAAAPELKGDLPGMNERLKLYETHQPFLQSFAELSASDHSLNSAPMLLVMPGN